MVVWVTVLAAVLVGVPSFAAITASAILLNRQRSSTTLMLFVAIFFTALWAAAGILYVHSLASGPISNDLEMIRVSQLLVTVTQLLILIPVLTLRSGRLSSAVTRIAIGLLIIYAGISFLSAIDPSINLTEYVREDKRIFIQQNDYVKILHQIGMTMFLLVLVFLLQFFSKLPETLVKSRDVKGNFAAIVTALVGTMMAQVSAIESLRKATSPELQSWLFLGSRIVMMATLVWVTLVTLQNPALVFAMKGSTRSLFHAGHVGWSFSHMTEAGPQVLSFSPEFAEKHEVEITDLQSLAIASTVSIGISQEFKDAVILLPVPKLDGMRAVCLAFMQASSKNVDKRYEDNKVPSVFSLILPDILWDRIGSFQLADTMIPMLKGETQDVKDFADVQKSTMLAKRILDRIV